jgi:hypothetical protein|tara:strand:+ start:467 stop:868 length:402 start_codon:yes stop_codon:yes gene_type:complete
MKILPALLIFIITAASPFTSSAEWTRVTKNIKGDTLYVDLGKIRKHNGYVYWWYLVDYLKPIKHGVWSLKAYVHGDCKKLRYKIYSDFPYKKPMGKGTASSSTNKPDKDWRNSPANSSTEKILTIVCNHKNNK